MSDEPNQTEKPVPGRPRRPPLAEIDTWELWQAWRRGDRARALPWIGLLVGFCTVLAAMYAFFYFSTGLTGDTVAQVILTIVFLAFTFALWRRISPRRTFALAVVGLMLALSIAVFLLWLAVFAFSGWSIWVGVFGPLALGLAGLIVGLPSLNAIGRQQDGPS